MKIVECIQCSPEWWLARRGVPTASDFDKILTPKTQKASASQEPFINQLIAERFATVWPDESGFVSSAMANGIENEPIARAWYEFEHDCDVTEVGFCLSDCGRFGCSPDGLVGDEGGIELKCPSLETHVKYLREGVLPAEYRCQVHGEILVTGRAWFDFVSYAEGLPPFCIRVVPDEFTKQLGDELSRFCDRYATELAKIEAMRS